MRENSTEQNRVLELMAEQMGKTASPEEEEELIRLLSAHPSFAYLAEVVSTLKGSAEHVEKNVSGPELVLSGWEHLAEKMSSVDQETTVPVRQTILPAQQTIIPVRSHIRWKSGWWKVAAALLIVTAAALTTGHYLNAGRPESAEANKSLKVGYGHRSKLMLSDGTIVWLNAGSKLLYPDQFSGKRREVTLEGEAFFDVAKEDHPFLVHTGKITVRVLGTRFNVKAYQEDARVSATLISGKIQVILNEDPEKKILLSPHEKLTVVAGRVHQGDEAGNELQYQVQRLPQVVQDSFPETAWLDNRMVFTNESFEEVARQLERRYGIEITFDGEGLRQEHVSGVFEKENLSQALDILKMTTKFNYRIDSNRVRLVAGQ
jgi:ferric-dicitrate binding protein FerR (iron transport regulator)